MKQWIIWQFVKGNMTTLLDKLKIFTHPGVTYSAYAYGAAKIIYGVAGYSVDSLNLDQAMAEIKAGVEVLFFTTVGSGLKHK